MGSLEKTEKEVFAKKGLVGTGCINPSIFFGSAGAFTPYASSSGSSYTLGSISSPIKSSNPSLLITSRRSFIRSFII
jgi:hypothetical protein